jgi:hypothetical protein
MPLTDRQQAIAELRAAIDRIEAALDTEKARLAALALKTAQETR